MKKYICLNHGECNWADEIPPREFSLDDADTNCPNCGSANIREATKPSKLPWKKIAIAAAAVLLLVIGVVWALTPPPLGISVEANCTNNTITVSTVGGSGKLIRFNSPELRKIQADSVFRIPADKLFGTTLTFWAVQDGDSVKTSLVTNCKGAVDSTVGGDGESGNQPPHRPQEKRNPVSVMWSRVEGSEFCDPDMNCIQYYSERNNLGQIREGKRRNCAACGKVEDGNE